MRPMPLPDLDYATLPVPAGADFQAVVKALADVPGCEPQPDPNPPHNMQGVYRIDGNPEDGFVLTYPAPADPAAVAATFTAVTPPAVPEPTIDEKVAVAVADELTRTVAAEVAKQLAAAGALPK